MISSSKASHQCELKVAKTVIGASSLSFEWSLRNLGTQSVYIFHRLFNEIVDDVFETSPNFVYIEFDSDGTLISKKIFPVPDDIDVESRVVPCASRLGPNESYEERVEIPLPLRLSNPYGGKKPRDTERMNQKVWFQIGWVAIPEAGEKHVRDVRTRGGKAYHLDTVQPWQQVLSKAGPFSGDAPVCAPS